MDRRHALRWLALLMLGAGAGGCGFRPRGLVQLPREAALVFIDSADPRSRLADRLRAGVRRAGGEDVRSAAEARVSVRVLAEEVLRRTLAVGLSGNTRQAELRYVVEYRIDASDGKALVAPQRLEFVRDAIYPEAEVLGRIAGEELLIDDMLADASATILRRLQGLGR